MLADLREFTGAYPQGEMVGGWSERISADDELHPSDAKL